jgi:hypothetical protein
MAILRLHQPYRKVPKTRGQSPRCTEPSPAEHCGTKIISPRFEQIGIAAQGILRAVCNRAAKTTACWGAKFAGCSRPRDPDSPYVSQQTWGRQFTTVAKSRLHSKSPRKEGWGLLTGRHAYYRKLVIPLTDITQRQRGRFCAQSLSPPLSATAGQ